MLGALVIAFSAILVDLADVTPADRGGLALRVRAAAARRDRVVGAPPLRPAQRRASAGSRPPRACCSRVDILVWHYAIDDVGAGLATVLGNLQVVVVPFLALAVFGERVPRSILFALPPVCVGVLLVSGALEDGAYGANPARGALLGMATGLAYAAFLLVQRQGSMDLRRPGGRAVRHVARDRGRRRSRSAWSIGVDDIAPRWPSAGWLITLALTSQVLGWLLISVSLPRLPAAMTSIILTIQPIGSVVLGAVLLGQEPSALQLCGVALILAGCCPWRCDDVSLRERLAEGRAVLIDGGLSTALEELGADLGDPLWTARVLRDAPDAGARRAPRRSSPRAPRS